MTDAPVVVVGAGLAGLTCARALARQQVPVRLIERADGVGGRVRTDVHHTEDGDYLLDRGFQVYLTAYPEGQQQLDYDALQFCAFRPGAMVRFEGRFWRVTDPYRQPLAAMTMLRSPIVTARDLVRLGMLDRRLRRGAQDEFDSFKGKSAETLLREAGLSDRVIDRFFRPFFGGVFLNRSLQTSARMLAFTYRMFAQGQTALPADGMQAIAAHLRDELPTDAVHLNREVVEVTPSCVKLNDGTTIDARAVVLATDGAAAATLSSDVAPVAWERTVCLYFAANEAPSPEPILYLDGDGTGPANHVAVLSNVQRGYAPAGRALICANIVAPHLDALADDPVPAIQQQMIDWFGPAAGDWQHMKAYDIPHALPRVSTDLPSPKDEAAPSVDGIYTCGDHRATASINGAMQSGRRAAEAVLNTYE